MIKAGRPSKRDLVPTLKAMEDSVAASVRGERNALRRSPPHVRQAVVDPARSAILEDAEACGTYDAIGQTTLTTAAPRDSRTHTASSASRRTGGSRNHAALILSNTQVVLKDLMDRSDFFQKNPQRKLPTFEPHDVEVGEVLGTGEFGVVLEIQRLRVEDGDEKDARKPVESGAAAAASAAAGQSSPPRSITVPGKTAKPSLNPTGPHKRQSSRSLMELEQGIIDQELAAAVPAVNAPGSVSEAVPEEEEDVLLDTPGEPLGGEPRCSSDNRLEDTLMDSDHHDDKSDHDSLHSAITTSTGGRLKPEEMPLEQTRHALSEHVLREGLARYAIKRLRLHHEGETADGPQAAAQAHRHSHHEQQHIMNATIDLACEATFLASLSHSNIVRLRATVGTVGHASFCIIMDRLTDTLENRMAMWLERSQQCQRPPHLALMQAMIFSCRKPPAPRNEKQLAWQQLYADRLLAAFDIARAVRYLHANRIIYRDLKPDNIGFDVRGNVRIFDFGLAKELKKHDLVEAPDKYDATGLTGSRRFMAPECVRCLPYGFSADVYSYAILLWQIFALKVPFPSINVRKHYEQVVVKHQRPNKYAAKLSPMITHMMTSAWDADPSKRPSFKQICQQLQAEILDATTNEHGEMGIVDRSTHLLNRSLNSLYNNLKEVDNTDDDYR